MTNEPRQVTAEELEEAQRIVCAMTDDEFFDAADRIGLDPWSGMKRGRYTWNTGNRGLRPR